MLDFVRKRFIDNYIREVIRNVKKAFHVVLKKNALSEALVDFYDSETPGGWWMKKGWRTALHKKAVEICDNAIKKYQESKRG